MSLQNVLCGGEWVARFCSRKRNYKPLPSLFALKTFAVVFLLIQQNLISLCVHFCVCEKSRKFPCRRKRMFYEHKRFIRNAGTPCFLYSSSRWTKNTFSTLKFKTYYVAIASPYRLPLSSPVYVPKEHFFRKFSARTCDVKPVYPSPVALHLNFIKI